MSCVYFAAILEAKKILPTLYYGRRAGLGQKICCSLAERAGPGSFMLAPGGPGCKSAGPCHLYYTGKAFYDRAATEIACHDHSMLLKSARYYILFS